MKIPVRKIAEEAGVSPASVSRYINGSEDVSSEIASKVESALFSLGGSPVVRRPRKQIILILLTHLRFDFYGRTLAELLEQEPQTEAAARYLAVIRERTDAMRALTEELFRYSVLTATADELHTEPVCLNDVLEQSLAGFYGTLSARGITPSVHLPEEKVIRPLDAAALRRVFDNILISNAAEYSDGDLAVVLAPDGKVTFSNRASALSRVEAARRFDRFYTVDSARGSTGLGLSIAKLLTEKLHGTISADYENETLRICIAFPTEKQGGI